MRYSVFLTASFCLFYTSLGAPFACAQNSQTVVREPVSKAEFSTYFTKTSMLAYPNFFFAKTSNGQNLIVSSIQEGSGVSIASPHTKHILDWYNQFWKEVGDKFEPQKPGGIFARIQIEKGGVKSITFEPYKHAKYWAQKPPRIEQFVNETGFRQSVVATLEKVTRNPRMQIPPGIDRIQLKFGFAGDPKAGSFGLDF